jgi:hypothetical protein
VDRSGLIRMAEEGIHGPAPSGTLG